MTTSASHSEQVLERRQTSGPFPHGSQTLSCIDVCVCGGVLGVSEVPVFSAEALCFISVQNPGFPAPCQWQMAFA